MKRQYRTLLSFVLLLFAFLSLVSCNKTVKNPFGFYGSGIIDNYKDSDTQLELNFKLYFKCNGKAEIYYNTKLSENHSSHTFSDCNYSINKLEQNKINASDYEFIKSTSLKLEEIDTKVVVSSPSGEVFSVYINDEQPKTAVFNGEIEHFNSNELFNYTIELNYIDLFEPSKKPLKENAIYYLDFNSSSNELISMNSYIRIINDNTLYIHSKLFDGLFLKYEINHNSILFYYEDGTVVDGLFGISDKNKIIQFSIDNKTETFVFASELFNLDCLEFDKLGLN